MLLKTYQHSLIYWRRGERERERLIYNDGLLLVSVFRVHHLAPSCLPVTTGAASFSSAGSVLGQEVRCNQIEEWLEHNKYD